MAGVPASNQPSMAGFFVISSAFVSDGILSLGRKKRRFDQVWREFKLRISQVWRESFEVPLVISSSSLKRVSNNLDLPYPNMFEPKSLASRVTLDLNFNL
jgi:hypothetical protein